MSGKSVIVEIDSNSKLGTQYIPNDPYQISPNGRMLARVIDNHALIVANSSTRCTGLITRRRVTKYRTEESCIDVLLFSSDLQQYFTSLLIDEERKYVLTKINKTKNGVTKKESDHHVLLSEFKDIMFNTKTTKHEIYYLKILNVRRGSRNTHQKQTCCPAYLIAMMTLISWPKGSLKNLMVA